MHALENTSTVTLARLDCGEFRAAFVDGDDAVFGHVRGDRGDPTLVLAERIVGLTTERFDPSRQRLDRHQSIARAIPIRKQHEPRIDALLLKSAVVPAAVDWTFLSATDVVDTPFDSWSALCQEGRPSRPRADICLGTGSRWVSAPYRGSYDR